MFKNILRFESGFLLKQLPFSIFAIVLFIYGVTVSVDDIGQGMELICLNSPYRINYFIALTSVFSVPVCMVFCISTQLRDEEHGFDRIIGVLAFKHRSIARFFVVSCFSLITITLFSLGMMAGMLSPNLEPSELTAFQLSHYIWPWIVFVVPTVFTCSVILFSITQWHRRSATTYAASLALFSIFWLAMSFTGAPILGTPISATAETTNFFALLDPFGVSAFFEYTQFWTPTQKNQQLIHAGGLILINRIIWLAIAFSFLIYFRHHCFTFIQVHADSDKKYDTEKPVPEECTNTANFKRKSHGYPTNASISHPQSASPIANIKARIHHVLTFVTLIGFNVSKLVKQWPFVVLMLVWLGVVFIGIGMVVGFFGNNEFSGRYPSTSLLISQTAEVFHLTAIALIIFYSAESLWEDGLVKMDRLVDVAPASNVKLYLSKLLALWFIPVTMLSILILACLSTQILKGYTRFELHHYVSLYYYFGLPVFLQTILVVLCQALVKGSRISNKYVAMLISASILLLSANIVHITGINQPLIQINQFPSLIRAYSDFTGYGQSAIKFHWFAMLWTCFAFMLAITTISFWNRGEASIRYSPFLIKSSDNFLSQKAWLPLCCFVLATIATLVTGWLVYQKTQLANDYQTENEYYDNLQVYEERYKKYQSTQNPSILFTSISLDIYPEHNSYQVHAENVVSNNSVNSLTHVFITSKLPLSDIEIEAASLILTDCTKSWCAYLFEFIQPFQSGSSVTMRYQVKKVSTAFTIDKGIASNGTYISQGDFEPVLGYLEELEIAEPIERSHRNLPDKGRTPSNIELAKRLFEIKMSTSANQTAISSGELVHQWQQSGRNYFQYKTQQPIFPIIGYFSGEYQLKKRAYLDIPIELYFHPNHSTNTDEIFRAAAATLDYANANFGDYAYQSLRIVEVPGYHPFGGRASAGVVALSEARFMDNYSDSLTVNNVARNTIHEVAHQWWGEKLSPKEMLGAKVITESLAKFAENEVLQKLEGSAMSTMLTQFNQRRYFSGRAYTYNAEPSLVNSDDENYLSYGKGPIIFLALKELLGETELYNALHRFITHHHSSTTANITSLVNELHVNATGNQRTLINDWLLGVFEYDLSIENASLHRLENGQYKTEFDVLASRISIDENGLELRTTIDEPLLFALFDKQPIGNTRSIIHQETIQINQSTTRVRLLSTQEPKFVAVDPNFTRLDQSLSNNTMKLNYR